MTDYSPQRTVQRRNVFEESAETYHRLRPPYPTELFDDLERLAGLQPGSVVVEVGSGTGLGTAGLVGRGYSLACIEPAEKMAAIARANLGDAFEHVLTRFEDFEAPPGSIDLVFAATSWLWVDPAVGFEHAAELVGRDGHLAHAWQTLVDLGPEGLEERLDVVYQAAAPELSRTFQSQRTVADGWAERIAESGYFAAPQILEYCYERSFDAASFVGSASTYGMHAGLEPARRKALDDGIIAVIDNEFGGQATRYERSLLFVAPTR